MPMTRAAATSSEAVMSATRVMPKGASHPPTCSVWMPSVLFWTMSMPAAARDASRLPMAAKSCTPGRFCRKTRAMAVTSGTAMGTISRLFMVHSFQLPHVFESRFHVGAVAKHQNERGEREIDDDGRHDERLRD